MTLALKLLFFVQGSPKLPCLQHQPPSNRQPKDPQSRDCQKDRVADPPTIALADGHDPNVDDQEGIREHSDGQGDVQPMLPGDEGQKDGADCRDDGEPQRVRAGDQHPPSTQHAQRDHDCEQQAEIEVVDEAVGGEENDENNPQEVVEDPIETGKRHSGTVLSWRSGWLSHWRSNETRDRKVSGGRSHWKSVGLSVVHFDGFVTSAR